jgi:hypothetical protein
VTAAPAWRTSSPAASWCSRCGGSRPMGCWHGRRSSERGFEGYVAKDEASPYEGGPTRLKVKEKGWTVEDDRWQRRISAAPSAR